MKKTTILFAAIICITAPAYAAEYYDGIHLYDCTSKYIDTRAIESFNYEDNSWKLVIGNNWGGSNCSLIMSTACENALISAMGSAKYTDNSTEAVLTHNIDCSCRDNNDCVTGFKCTSLGSTFKYGRCTPISNFCTSDSQCATAKGYVCVNKVCTQKCAINTQPDNTNWETAAKDTTYGFPTIEKSTTYKCSSSGSWTGTTSYRCASNYYGTPTSASSICTRCPAFPGPATSEPGSTKITDCYIPNGQPYGDTTGSFTVVNGDCYYN